MDISETEEKILREEEGEEREVASYQRRMEEMRETCRGMDPQICRLIEEQQDLLCELREENSRFLDDFAGCRAI